MVVIGLSARMERGREDIIYSLEQVKSNASLAQTTALYHRFPSYISPHSYSGK
jgi:hypothetical protein